MTPVCTPGHPPSVCLVSSDILEKVLLQVGHEYFFTSECVCRCARKFERSAKARLQCGHENGFSPVCVRMWPCSSHGLENALPHCMHLQGNVCVRMCIFSAPSELYSFSQYLHLNFFLEAASSLAVQWNCWCLDRPEYVEYDLEQKVHLYRGTESLHFFLELPELLEALLSPLLPTLPGDDRSSGLIGGGDGSG